MEDLHAALGYGKFSARQVLQKLAPEQVPPEASGDRPRPGRSSHGRAGAGRDDQDLVIKVQGIGRPAGLPRQVLQSDSRRSHRRLRDARQGRCGSFARIVPTCRT